MNSFELALARDLVQNHGYTWFPPGVLFPEPSLFRSKNNRGFLIRIVDHVQPDSIQAFLQSSFLEADEILKDHPYKGITVLQLFVYPTLPDEESKNKMKKLERHEFAPEISIYTAWFDLETKKFSSNVPWFIKILSKDALIHASEHIKTDQDLEDLQQEIVLTQKNRKNDWRNVFVQTSSKAVYSLLAIIIGMFLWTQIIGTEDPEGALIKMGAKVNELILAGEYWRLVTPMFLHLGLLHIMVNAFALYSLRDAEWIYGSNRFLIIFLLAGISGNVASFVFSPYPALGASGAIFGILGSLLYFGTQRKDFFRRTMGSAIWATLAINLVMGLTIPQISNSGHIGGLIGGFLTAATLGLPKDPFRLYRPLAALLLILLLAVGLWYGFGY